MIFFFFLELAQEGKNREQIEKGVLINRPVKDKELCTVDRHRESRHPPTAESSSDRTPTASGTKRRRCLPRHRRQRRTKTNHSRCDSHRVTQAEFEAVSGAKPPSAAA